MTSNQNLLAKNHDSNLKFSRCCASCGHRQLKTDLKFEIDASGTLGIETKNFGEYVCTACHLKHAAAGSKNHLPDPAV